MLTTIFFKTWFAGLLSVQIINYDMKKSSTNISLGIAEKEINTYSRYMLYFTQKPRQTGLVLSCKKLVYHE